MKKLLIAVLISTIASFGLVSCSAPKNLKPEHKEVYRSMNGPEGRAFLQLTPGQQDEYLELRKYKQEINKLGWTQGWKKEESQKIWEFKTKEELKKHYDNLSKKYSTKNLEETAKVEKRPKVKNNEQKFYNLAKKYRATCKDAPFNFTMGTVSRLIQVRELSGQDAKNLRDAADTLGKLHPLKLDGDGYVHLFWNKLCKTFTTVYGDQQKAAGSLVEILPNTILKTAGYEELK